MELAETKTGEKSSTSLAHTSTILGIDPGQWSNSEMKTLELGGIPGCTGAYVGIEGGGVKEKTMYKSSTSPLGQFRDFLMRVCMSVSGPADVYLQMRRHYIRISGGRGLKGVPRAMPTLPYLTRWSYLLFLQTICTLTELARTHSMMGFQWLCWGEWK